MRSMLCYTYIFAGGWNRRGYVCHQRWCILHCKWYRTVAGWTSHSRSENIQLGTDFPATDLWCARWPKNPIVGKTQLSFLKFLQKGTTWELPIQMSKLSAKKPNICICSKSNSTFCIFKVILCFRSWGRNFCPGLQSNKLGAKWWGQCQHHGTGIQSLSAWGQNWSTRY